MKNVGLTVEGSIYGCYISRHITREATVVPFKVYATFCATIGVSQGTIGDCIAGLVQVKLCQC